MKKITRIGLEALNFGALAIVPPIGMTAYLTRALNYLGKKKNEYHSEIDSMGNFVIAGISSAIIGTIGTLSVNQIKLNEDRTIYETPHVEVIEQKRLDGWGLLTTLAKPVTQYMVRIPDVNFEQILKGNPENWREEITPNMNDLKDEYVKGIYSIDSVINADLK